MKKSSSLHLEEDIWKEIDDYKDKYKLSSRNAAIERMLIERRMLLLMCKGSVIDNTSNHNLNIENKENDKIEFKDTRITKELKNTILNSYSNMPD